MTGIPLAPWQGPKVNHNTISRPQKFTPMEGLLTFVDSPRRRDPKVGLLILIIDTPAGPVRVPLNGDQCRELMRHLMDAVSR